MAKPESLEDQLLREKDLRIAAQSATEAAEDDVEEANERTNAARNQRDILVEWCTRAADALSGTIGTFTDYDRLCLVADLRSATRIADMDDDE